MQGVILAAGKGSRMEGIEIPKCLLEINEIPIIKHQIKYFKKKVKLKSIRKNDMIFWKGHVAVALSRNKLIHAYGPMKKVVIMSIKKTIERIYKTANLKVTSIRRA